MASVTSNILTTVRNSKAIERALTGGVRAAVLLTPILLAMATRQSTFLISILIDLLIVQYFLRYDEKNSVSQMLLINLLEIIIVVYLIFNLSIAPDVVKARPKIYLVLYLFAATYFSLRGLVSFSRPAALRLANRLVIGMLIGGSLATFEILLDYPFTKIIFEMLPGLYSEKHKGIIILKEGEIRVQENFFNRNAACLVLIIWPALVLTGVFSGGIRVMILNAALFAMVFLCAAYSQSMTAKLALAGGVLVFFLATWRAHLTRNLLMAAWIAVSLLAVPLAHALHASGLAESAWVPDSAKARIVIWHHTAQLIPERPIFGAGIRSTQHYQDLENARSAGRSAADRYASRLEARLGWHAHNLYLQTWFELGFVGVVLLIALGVATLRKIARSPAELQPYGYALFASASLILASGWGMWQTWLLMSIMFAVLALALGNRIAHREAA